MAFPQSVKIVEVGPRDGLQNESHILPAKIKIDFINRLSGTGLKVIEATSFVSPKWIPQLADHIEVFNGIEKNKNVSYPVLIPNPQGFDNALAAGVKEIAVFTTPSELFCQRNTNCTVAESLQKIAEIMLRAKAHHIPVRGYLSCVMGCPYEGEISPESVKDLTEELLQMGCYEISLGDTIGVGTPYKTKKLIECIKKTVKPSKLAMHFHDTYGQALTNIYVGLEEGISTIDSSISGLGGCPYAKGASGNVATEDVIYMVEGMGINTGVDLTKLIAVGQYITQKLKRPTQSKVNIAFQSR